MNSDPLILDLINMISIPSINNFGSNDINQNPENEMSNYFERQLSKLGLEVESCEVANGRRNVWGRLKGTGGGPTIMLAGHMDTVGVDGYDNPFVPKIENGKDVWDGCLIRHSLFQAKEYEIDVASPSGREAAGTFWGGWQVTIRSFTRFVENYSGTNAVLDFLYEDVYKPHNDDFSISTEHEEKFKQEFVPKFAKLITDVNAALD